MTSGDGISACSCASHRPSVKHWGPILTVFSSVKIRLRTRNKAGDACRRLKKMVLRHTGEILRRPTFGKPCL